MKNLNRNSVIRYIGDDTENAKGLIKHLDLKEGARKWSKGNYADILEFGKRRNIDRISKGEELIGTLDGDKPDEEKKIRKLIDRIEFSKRRNEKIASLNELLEGDFSKKKDWDGFRKPFLRLLNREDDYYNFRERSYDDDDDDSEEEFRGSGTDKKGLWNDEIEKILKELLPDEDIPVIANDQINTLNVDSDTGNFGFIVNTDDADGPGQHWKAVFVSRDECTVEIYDSLVSIPTKKFMQDLRGLVDKMDDCLMYKVKINSVKDQSNSSSNCGYFAIKFLKDRFEGKPFKDATFYNEVEKSDEGEKKIEKFKRYL